MTIDPLARELASIAPAGVVEHHGALAVLAVDDSSPFQDRPLRTRMLAAAAAYGVTHLALELLDHGDGADSPRFPRA